MRAATVRAAMRRGCVWPISPLTPRLSSRQILGSWVVLPRAGFAANDDDLVGVDGARDLLAPRDDRQFVGISRLRQVGEPLLRIEARSGHGGAHCSAGRCGRRRPAQLMRAYKLQRTGVH